MLASGSPPPIALVDREGWAERGRLEDGREAEEASVVSVMSAEAAV
jgi:hypothetical protein